MSRDRWERIEELFHKATALAPRERHEFLAQACAEDDKLRDEIETLIASDRSKDDLLGPAISKTADRMLAEWEGSDDLLGARIGPYLVTKLIGAGGMGRVYLAEDSRLGRRVALKSLPEGFAQDPAACERFRREARTLSALNHPNICTIFDVLEKGQRNFIVMEYIEGTPLSGPLPVRTVLSYARQICDALDAAHRKGFIHHDLKPANILVAETGIKLLDFGLARVARTQDDSTLTQGLTRAGTIMGTPAYMSPEQAEGKTVDPRSDIFSLGAILYELLAGRRAFSGDSTASIISAVLRDDPPPLEAPPAIAKPVMRCLRKQPAERFQTIGDLRAALEQSPESVLDHQPSIAVLPFANFSADKEDEYFSDGLGAEIINLLALVPGLKVIARTSAFAFRGKEQDIRKIAGALGVRTILEGSLRRSGNRIRITAQLIDADDGSHLWSERFDRELTDFLAVQDEIAAAIAAALKVKLAADGKHRGRRETEDKEAYALYLRGRYLQNERSPDLLKKGIEYFERAIERDPSYALPYAGLSDLLCIAGFWGREPPDKVFPRVIAAATDALGLDQDLGEAHASLALARDLYYWDWQASELEFKRALQLNPNSPLAHIWYSYHLSMLGRHEEAIDQARIGVDLDPLSTSVNFGAARAYFYARRYDETIAQSRRGLELGSDDFPTLFQLGESYLQKGMRSEAIAWCQASVEASSRHPVALGSLGHVFAECGMRDEAETILAELSEAYRSSYVPAATIAFIHLGLHHTEELLHWLQEARKDHSTILPYVLCSPASDWLQSNSGFQDICRQINLRPVY